MAVTVEFVFPSGVFSLQDAVWVYDEEDEDWSSTACSSRADRANEVLQSRVALADAAERVYTKKVIHWGAWASQTSHAAATTWYTRCLREVNTVATFQSDEDWDTPTCPRERARLRQIRNRAVRRCAA